MNNITESFLLTTLAGLSTMLGTIFIFLKKREQLIYKSLSFAAGVMITVSLTDLIPEGQNLLSKTFFPIPVVLISMIFFIIGIIITMTLNHYLPESKEKKINHKLYKIGIISMLAIMLHNIPEGIMTFMTSTHNMTLGISLTIAIALHNIPEGISISIPIFYASGNKKKAFLYTFISGISELIGAILAFIFLKDIMNEAMMGMLYSMTAGIMIYISLHELLPTSLQSNYQKKSLLYFLIGVGVMFINHYQ